jgi:hypothetical protein
MCITLIWAHPSFISCLSLCLFFHVFFQTELPSSNKKDLFSSFNDEDDDEVQDDEFDGEDDDEDMDEEGDSEDDVATLRKMTLEQRAALLDQLDEEERADAAAEMERMVRGEQSVYNLTEAEGDNDENDEGQGGMKGTLSP